MWRVSEQSLVSVRAVSDACQSSLWVRGECLEVSLSGAAGSGAVSETGLSPTPRGSRTHLALRLGEPVQLAVVRPRLVLGRVLFFIAEVVFFALVVVIVAVRLSDFG